MFKNKKFAALTPVILFLIISALIMGTIAIATYDKPAAQPTNSFYNLMNGGYVAVDGTLTYFIDSEGALRCQGVNNSYRIADGNCDSLYPYKSGVIYRQNGHVKYSSFNGSEEKLILENIDDFMVSGDWIYYVQSDLMLKKMRIDDKKVHNLNLKIDGQFAITGTSIIFIGDQNYLYSANTDGTNTKAFYSEAMNKFMIFQPYIYYLSNGKLCSVLSSNSASKTTIATADQFCMMSGIIIYTQGDQMYSLDLTTKGSDPRSINVLGTNPHSLCIAGDYVYYQNNEGQMIKMLKDGSESTVM